MSARAELQERIAAFMSENGLFDFIGETGQSENRRYRFILFGVRRVLDGDVKIFSEKFLQISYATAYHHLPRQDSRVFQSEADLLEFLKLAFVDKTDAAMDVPVKPSSR